MALPVRASYVGNVACRDCLLAGEAAGRSIAVVAERPPGSACLALGRVRPRVAPSRKRRSSEVPMAVLQPSGNTCSGEREATMGC